MKIINNTTLKLTLITIAILNILDGVLTYIGVNSGYIREGNILLVSIVNNLPLVILLKCVIVPGLLLGIYHLIKNIKIGLTVKLVIGVCLVVYFLIFCMHIGILVRLFI
jgi:hypothetical protein